MNGESEQGRFQQRWYLYRQLVRRDIEQRYKATAGGMVWAIIQPIIMIGIYVLVFGLIFQPKWPSVASSWDYVLILFLGKIPYLLVTESMSMAAASMHGHVNLVKKTLFPLRIIPLVVIGSCAYHAVIAVLVWVLFYLFIKQDVSWGVILLPLIWLPLILFCVGVCWMLAIFGAYFRDVNQFVASFNIALMFLSPIFYPAASAPGALKIIMNINPLSYAIEASRNLLLWPEHFSWSGYPIQLLASLLCAGAGLMFFNRMRPGLADVL